MRLIGRKMSSILGRIKLADLGGGDNVCIEDNSIVDPDIFYLKRQSRSPQILYFFFVINDSALNLQKFILFLSG